MGRSSDNLDIDHLPQILRFNESETPQLIETHKRIVETAAYKGAEQAAAVANTYEELADEYLKNRHSIASGKLPEPALDRSYPIAKGGMLIHMANIWHEAMQARPSVRRLFIDSLDRAINYARNQRWLSIVTVLENEKQKQFSAH